MSEYTVELDFTPIVEAFNALSDAFSLATASPYQNAVTCREAMREYDLDSTTRGDTMIQREDDSLVVYCNGDELTRYSTTDTDE